MARRSPIKVGLALALICVITGHGQADDNTCRTGCRGAPHTFKHQEGTTYKYTYDSKIEVSLSSAEGQKSLTEVKATVLLTQQSQCNQILRLQNVQVIGSDGKKHGHIPDIEKPIRINYHDGHLEDSICVTPGDSQNSLNIKRAVASMFQANLKPSHETDVFGLCPTEVSHHQEGSVLVIQKSRNLNRCAYRENIKQDFLSTAFNLNSEIKSSPLLNADYSAKLRVKNGILEQATVHESYLYVPFSVGNNGAKASVETSLKLAGTSKDNAQAKVSQPRSIIFEDPHPVNSPNANVNSILGAVKATAKTIDVTVNENTAKEFANLIRILRVSKKDDLLAVYNQVRAGAGFPDKEGAKKLFLDALLRAGNGDNIEVAIELLKNKELNTIEQNLVYLGLSTVRHPTENSINSVVTLLNQNGLPRRAYLGIGALAGRYCRLHSCKNVDAINKLTQKLVQKLGNGKAGNREEENDIVYVLKALANIHHLNDNILAKITAIAQDKKAPSRVRVAALETYLADPCKDKLRDSALTILKDIQQDSEIRIKAYLAVAQCPNTKVSNAVKTLLEHEPSYQVGGFIVSHIRNLRASANPDKELAKQHLGLLNLPKRFPFDPRKYSFNGEFSYTVDTLGLANSVDSNIIYSQNSFLPRSTSLNLTAEVFGHTFNFLEIETRQENLDRLIEHYLGPQGSLRTRSLAELWNSKKAREHEIINKFMTEFQRALREKRDVSKSEIDSIAKQVHIKTNSLNTDLDLDLSVKTFGSELFFLNLNEDITKFTPEGLIDNFISKLKGGLNKLQKFEETLRSNLLFLDAELAYPTSAGFPLRLGVEGSSNIQVKASGALDIRSFLARPSDLKITLIPSATIEVSGRLTVDALVVENGLKVTSTLHTSTGADVTLSTLQDGIDIKFGLPLEKQELITATHEIVLVSREWGLPEHVHPLKFSQNKDFSICLDQLSPFIGLTFCGEITGPNLQGEKVPILPFPFSGDAKVGITIEKDDLSYFHFKEAVYLLRDKLGAEWILEAYGKNGQKKASVELEGIVTKEDKHVKAALTSQVMSVSLEGRLIDTDKEKGLLAKFVQDNNEYSAKIGVTVQGNQAKSIYKPILELKAPPQSGIQIPPYKIEGQVIVERPDPATVTYNLDNVRLVIPDQKTISLNGKLGSSANSVFTDLTASDGQNSATFKGNIEKKDYGFRYNGELRNNLNPEANFQVKGELGRVADELKNSFHFAHGGDFSNKNNILTIENSLKLKNRGPHDHLLQTKNKLSYPGAGAFLQGDFELKPRAVQYLVDAQYDNVKVGSELEWEHEQKQGGIDFRIQFGVWGLNNKLNFKSKRQVNGDISQIENSLEVNGKRMEINGKVRHHIRPQDVDVGSDLIIKLPTHNTPFHVVNGLRTNANEFDASHKVTAGNTVYVDVFLKTNRAGNANGSIKINLPGALIANGHLKANKGNGNGEIVIELPDLKKTVKIDSTFTIHEPNYNIQINIYPFFNDDKAQKIVISTHTTFNLQDLDSKNLIDVFGHKLEANVKAHQSGEISNGKINAEAEVTLPNDNYFAGKFNRDLKNNNGLLNGDILATAEFRTNKNQPGNKVTVKGQLRNTKPDDNIYDVAYQLSAECAHGQNVNVDLSVKKQPQGNLEVSNKISGSILKGTIESSYKGHCKDGNGDFVIKSSYAPLGQIAVKGKHNFEGASKPISGELEVDLTSTSEVVKTVKAAISASVSKKEEVDFKGEAKIYADSPKGVIIDLTTNGEVKASDKDGRVKGSIKSGNLNPISVNAGYTYSENKNQRQIKGDLQYSYGQNQNIKGDVTLIKLPHHEYKLDVKLDTPNEKYKNNRLQVHTKRNEEGTHYQSDVVGTTNGKTWTTNSDILISETTPSFDIKVKCPEGKLRQILFKISKLSDRQLAGQVKLVNQKSNFLLEGSIDANVESVDEFHIKLTANSPNLKLDKIVIEAQNKPAKTGRRIQVNAKSANKNVLAGSTSYTAREEHGKLIVEGSGSFKVHDQTKSANFKYIRQNLNQAKNGETGIEISFDAGLGNQAIDAELKVTNKQFRILNSYCEEKKQCAHVEIDVKTNSNDVDNYNQEIEIAIDLRKLGLSHEFGLKAVTVRKNLILDHTVDVHFQSQENNKYQYSLYLHPGEAGVSLTTPKRIIALEAKVNIPPTLLKDGGKASGEVSLYMDKKHQPNQKAGVTAFLNIDPKGQHLEGEVRLNNPALKRPLLVSVNSKVTPGNRLSVATVLVVDIFAQANQKLTINIHEQYPDRKNPKIFDAEYSVDIKSSGLNIDIRAEEYGHANVEQNTAKGGYKLKYHVANSRYESEASYDYSPRNLQVLLKVLNREIFRLNSQMQLSKEHQVINSEIHCLGQKPLVSHLEVKNMNTLKYTVSRKESPNNKLQVNAGFIPGQIADLRAEIIKEGASQELGHVTVKLDEANFLKSDYNVQSKNVEEFLLKPISMQVEVQRNELQKLSDEWSKNAETEAAQLSNIATKATPDYAPLAQYYRSELGKIKEEILADKNIKDLSEFLYNIFSAVSQAFGESFAAVSELVENIVKSFQNTFGTIIEAFQKELLPKFKILGDQFVKLITVAVDGATQIVLTVVARGAQFAEEFRPQLQEILAILQQVNQDIFKAFLNVYDALRTAALDLYKQFIQEIQQFPAVEQLKAEYNRYIKEGAVDPEAITNVIRDIVKTLQDVTPFEEMKELLSLIGDYLTLKLTGKPVDDAAVFEKITKTSVALVAKILSIWTSEEVSPDLQNIQLPLPANILYKLPRFAVVRLSPLSYLLRQDWQSPEALILSLVNKPRNWFPPFPLYGLLAQGQHVFTFDGKHLTFPGKCNYLLARDALDGNFSIIGSYNNGLLSSISLSQGDTTITLRKHGQVTVDNTPSELPVRRPNVAAYRDTEKIVLRTKYGAKVMCGPELVVCSVTLSGFYHGRTRGLLGNGNNEPYDDFTLPSGKIVTSEGEFGNAYKTTGSCGDVQTVSHSAHHATPACEKLFGWESGLRYCYPFVNVANFKMACEHGLASNVKDTEHAIAVAYVAACNQHGIPVRVPAEFVKCTNGDKPTALGDSFSVKTPGKEADIVLLVDTNHKNEAVYKDYVQPLVQQLTNELHSKGVSDVEFHIIAYGGENEWPSHITTSGGKLTFTGKAPNLKFSNPPPSEQNFNHIPQIFQGLGHDLDLALGENLQAKTYNEGLKYPFRANAIKSIIAVTGQPCEVGRFFPLQLLRTLLYRGKNIHLNLITPVDRAGAKPDAKNIVGFNSRNVFTLPGAKNKIKQFADLDKELDYHDYCIDFTVQNDGNVFVSDHILLQAKPQKKQFIQVTSHNIVDQFVSAEKGYDCECKYVSPFSASNVCKLAYSKEKASSKKAGTKS